MFVFPTQHIAYFLLSSPLYSTHCASQGGAIFFSSGNVDAVASNVVDCRFLQNSAYSGWGGAFFGTDSLGAMYISGSEFANNNAYSR